MSEIYKCNCGCGGVEISKWEDDGKKFVYIEFLKRCRSGRSWKQRLKMIWRLLRWGYYYDDEIILTKETAGNLGAALVKMSNS